MILILCAFKSNLKIIKKGMAIINITIIIHMKKIERSPPSELTNLSEIPTK